MTISPSQGYHRSQRLLADCSCSSREQQAGFEAVLMNGAWPGGPCPQCGDDMPAKLVHCRSCRALLNNELSEDSVEIPMFSPLPEIAVIAAVSPQGHYVLCPGCKEELRIHTKYRGLKVQCKHCSQPFNYNAAVEVKAFYTPCPHCGSELRAAQKYMGHKVVCKHCNGHIQLMPAE